MSNVKVSEIIDVVAGVFGVAAADLRTKETRLAYDARMVAMYLADRHTRLTSEQLAYHFGRLGCRALKRARQSIRDFAATIDTVPRDVRERIDLCESEIDEIHDRRTAEREQKSPRRVRELA